MSFTVVTGSTPVPYSYLIKVTLVTCEKSVVQFVSTKHRRFSPSVPVSSCSNTGSIRSGPYWTSRKNTLVISDRAMQYT